jgi:hypothetical protein
MTGTPPPARMGRLPLTDWPTADAAAWTTACNPLPGPFSQTRKRSCATYRMYAQGYAGFLWHLQRQGQLDPAETPAERVTRERLARYYDHLVQSGIADYTLVARFDTLRGALRLMCNRAQNLGILSARRTFGLNFGVMWNLHYVTVTVC